MSPLPTVLVVEDDPCTRDEIVAALAGDPRFGAVDAAATLRAARNALARSGRDLVVLDLGLPDGDGASLIAPARTARCQVLVLTVRDDPATVVRVIALGAAGYLVKEEAVARVGDALTALRGGSVVLSPTVTHGLLDLLPPAALEAPDALTPQEERVLAALRDGETYGQVAARLGVTINTVRTHVRNLYAKLRATSRHEALTRAVRR